MKYFKMEIAKFRFHFFKNQVRRFSKMAYNKYKKVKKGYGKTTGFAKANDYVSNHDKTIFSLKKISEYAENEVKTINSDDYKELITCINCKDYQFLSLAKKLDKGYHKNKTERLNKGHKANEGFHFVSSYKGRDLDPRLVHQLGIELAEVFCKDEFIAKVCTHLDTGNYHNHIIISAYALDMQHKFKDEFHLYNKIRRVSDEISLKYGIDFSMEGLYEKKNDSEIYAEKKGIRSITKSFKDDIRDCIKGSTSIEQFQVKMIEKGYNLIENTSAEKLSFIYEKDGQKVSDHRLGNRYTRDGICSLIDRNNVARAKKEIEEKRKEYDKRQDELLDFSDIYVKKVDDNGNRIPIIVQLLDLVRQYVKHLLDLFFDPQFPEELIGETSLCRADKKLEKLNHAIDVCTKHDIRTQEGLTELIHKTGMEMKTSEIRAARLFEAISTMENIVSSTEKLEGLEKQVRALGIDPDAIPMHEYTDEDVEKNIADIDPASGVVKRDLFNLVNKSDYAIAKSDFQKINRTDADAVMDFLKGKTEKKPNILLTKAEYDIKKKKEYIELKATDYRKSLHKENCKYDITDRQIKKLEYIYPTLFDKIDVKMLKKDQAMRIISHLAPNPIEDIKKHISEADPKQKPNQWELETLEVLSVLYAEDFKGLDIDKLTKHKCNNIIQWYLQRNDPIIEELTAPKTEKYKKSFNATTLDLKSLSDEQMSLLMEYKSLRDKSHSYGIYDNSDLEKFKENINEKLSEAHILQSRYEDRAVLYKDLKGVEWTVKHATDKAFIYGSKYTGQTKNFEEQIRQIDPPTYDRLLEIKTRLPEIKTKLSELEYITPEIKALLVDLSQAVPDEFEEINLEKAKTKQLEEKLESKSLTSAIEKVLERLSENTRAENLIEEQRRSTMHR